MTYGQVTAVVGIVSVVVYALWAEYSSKLPPGPFKFPIVGNIFQLPTSRLHLKLFEYAKKYGPITSLRVGWQNIIVLNNAEIAHELFVVRSQHFSSRPPLHITVDLLSKGQRIGMMPYGEQWKVGRKALQSYIGPLASKRHRNLQDLEATVLVHDLLEHGYTSARAPTLKETIDATSGKVPEGHWVSFIRRYATSVALVIAYGQRVTNTKSSARLHQIYEVFHNFTKTAQPGNAIVDAFPILRRLPDFLAPWRHRANEMHQWEMNLWGGLLNDLKNDLKQGNKPRERTEAGFPLNLPGIGLEGSWMKDTFLTYAGAAILEAGSETVATAIETFLLFMLANPRCLERVRKEIDEIVGEGRMPNFDDEDRLEYLKACIKESARMRPVAILGSPHSCENDQVVNGYVIPKHCVILGNVFAIQRDPERYPDPHSFIPERFLEGKNAGKWASGPEKERDHYLFGWGRRYCPGSTITEASLLITLSRIIWGLDLFPPIDPQTKEYIIPNVMDESDSFTDGLATGPKLYGIGFAPRSERHQVIIRKAFEDAQVEWSVLGLEDDVRS
ncbi:cytochrome P450 [Flagelloscypha sp. PMI_526]|nr:cytochrome P450 [Flagelloscypha sp. PMI_526]